MAITLATIRSDIGFRVRDPSAKLITNTEIDRWADSIQRDMAKRSRFIKQDRSFAVTAKYPFVALDADLIALEEAWWKSEQSLALLSRRRWYGDPVRPRGSTTGTPYEAYIEYSKKGYLLWLYPVPSATSVSTTMNDAGGISASDTSVTLTSAADFRSEGRIVIESEEIYYHSKSGNTLQNLQRGMGNTVAAAHVDAVSVQQTDLHIVYSRMPAALTTSVNAEVPDDHYETLINGILWIAYRSMGKHEEAGLSFRYYQNGITELKRSVATKDEHEDQTIHPDPASDWTYGDLQYRMLDE